LAVLVIRVLYPRIETTAPEVVLPHEEINA
jgi:hypothetical protein